MGPDHEPPPPSPESIAAEPSVLAAVAAMSHDIGDAIATITREADVIEHAARTHPSPAMGGAVKRVAQNVAYIERIASSLVEHARGRAGADLHLELARLGPLVENVTDRVVGTHDRNRVHCHATATAVVWIDVLAIERVIARLLRHALLRVPLDAPVWVRVDGAAALASVSFIDRAGGMREQAHAMLFAPPTADDARAHCLHDCRLVVEAHRGRVGIDNISGRGSRVYFELPADERDGHARAPQQGVPRLVVDELHVMLADDSCCRTWAIVDALHARGATTAIVRDEAQLTCAVAAKRPAVLVVEAEAGLELRLASVGASHAYQLPLVVTSWLPADAPDVARLVAIGASYVRRPIDIDCLLARIASLVQRR